MPGHGRRDFAPNAAMAAVMRDLVEQAVASRDDAVRYQELLQALADAK